MQLRARPRAAAAPAGGTLGFQQTVLQPFASSSAAAAAAAAAADVGAGGKQQQQQQAVKVTLHDCLACSGCVTSAETVLLQHQVWWVGGAGGAGQGGLRGGGWGGKGGVKQSLVRVQGESRAQCLVSLSMLQHQVAELQFGALLGLFQALQALQALLSTW